MHVVPSDSLVWCFISHMKHFFVIKSSLPFKFVWNTVSMNMICFKSHIYLKSEFAMFWCETSDSRIMLSFKHELVILLTFLLLPIYLFFIDLTWASDVFFKFSVWKAAHTIGMPTIKSQWCERRFVIYQCYMSELTTCHLD